MPREEWASRVCEAKKRILDYASDEWLLMETGRWTEAEKEGGTALYVFLRASRRRPVEVDCQSGK